MPYKQANDVLDDVRHVHQALKDRCRELSGTESDIRYTLLFNVLKSNEESLEESVARYQTNTYDDDLLHTWLQFPSEEEMNEAFQQLDLGPNMSAEEIVAEILTFNQRLSALYRDLSEYTDVPSLQALFADLRQLEENKQRQYARLLQDWRYHV